MKLIDMQNDTGLKTAVSLAVAVALAPAAVDMYLASMPQMAVDLNTSYTSTQLTLTVFLVFMGLGQLLFGPLSDAFGRRLPFLFGIFTYIVASLMAALSESLQSLILARILQGLGAAMAVVVVMSMVRDLVSGVQAAQLYALLNTIVALGPIIAPALGGVVDAHYGWRGVMFILAGLGVLVLLNSMMNIQETLPKEKRIQLNMCNVIKTYIQIFKNKVFVLNLLALSAAFFFVFAYIGGSSYVYQNNYGISSEQFGLIFGLTSVSLVLGASSSAYFVEKISIPNLAVIGAAIMTLGSLACVTMYFLDIGLMGIVLGIAIGLFGLGILEPPLMTAAMDSQTTSLGSTAALLGAFPLLLSSTATPLAGHLVELDALYWLILLGLIGPIILLLVYMSTKQVVATTENISPPSIAMK